MGLGLLALSLSGCSGPVGQVSVPASQQVPARGYRALIPSPGGEAAAAFWLDRELEHSSASIVDLTSARERILSGRWAQWGAWSPDGRLFAATRYAQGDRMETGLIDLVTLGWRPLPVDLGMPIASSGFPAWSPDGGKLMFLVSAGLSNVATDQSDWVCIYDLHSDRTVALVVGRIKYPANPWWRDHFVFRRVVHDPTHPLSIRSRFYLRRMEPPYTEIELLPGKLLRHVSVSPTGGQAVALGEPEATPPSSGSAARERDPLSQCAMYLLTGPDKPAISRRIAGELVSGAPMWSKRGDRVLAYLYSSKTEGLPGASLAVIDIATGTTTPLTDNRGGPVSGEQAYWTDDDRRLTFLRNGEAWSYEFATRGMRRLLPPERVFDRLLD